jgi:hypothetical protein
MDSPMKKMILMLKLAKRNSALAVTTVFGRLIWPSLLPLQSITQQMQRGFTHHIS